jgi:hypothetical protein
VLSQAEIEKQLRHLPQDWLDIILEVRNIVRSLCPQAVERLDRNGITYYDDQRAGLSRPAFARSFMRKTISAWLSSTESFCLIQPICCRERPTPSDLYDWEVTTPSPGKR